MQTAGVLSRLLHAASLAGPTPRLPLLGLFRVGTNITRTLLESHYAVRVSYNQLGWKHGLLPTHAGHATRRHRGLAPLVIVKHPLATVHSLHGYWHSVGRNMHSRGTDLAGFLRERITYFCEEQTQRPEYRFSNPVQMWNSVVWNHARFAERSGGLVMRYEDLLAHPEAACAHIARHYGLARRRPAAGPVRAEPHVARRMKDSPAWRRQRYVTEERFDKTRFFLQGEFFDAFSIADQRFAAAELDTELLAQLGYTLDRAQPLQPAQRLLS